MKERLFSFTQQIEQSVVVRSIRNGLVNMIPILIIGAFALIIKTFPIEAYQTALTTAGNGIFLNLLNLIYGGTFGVLSVYMTFFISLAYMRLRAEQNAPIFGAVSASLISFFILSGVNLSDFGTDNLGPKSMFMAIVTGLGASAIYLAFHRLLKKHHRIVLLSNGVDREFNRMLSTLLPIAITIIIFGVFDAIITNLFDVESFRELIINGFNGFFEHDGTEFSKGFLFVLLSSILWFFGIHGSDTLEGSMQTYFTPGLVENQAAAAIGATPPNIITKEFFDCFVLMGGCGATICLLISILLFSRNHARRELGIAATFPMIFNINELMVFGLPIIFNPILLIPFLAVPLVCFSVSYLAVSSGLVPLITGSVEWTTPIILGGYQATGSVAGSILQLVNVAIGVLIYLPFVRLLDKQTETEDKLIFKSFMDYFIKNEQALTMVRLTDEDNPYSSLAKGLCAELRHDMNLQVVLHYQPQYHYDGRCIGVESLLRWKHPRYGMLYPPLVIKLAQESGFLPDLEEAVLLKALEDRPKVLKQFGENVKISVNVTGNTVVTQRYLQYCRDLDERIHFTGKNICLEVTEQAAISFEEDTLSILRELHSMGFMLAIDDFSMGQTSLNYLKNNLFDLIKLDGSLVKGLEKQQNCREIILSITQLADSLGMTVLAEYVETEKQREQLHTIGCDFYQGYLYSPAVSVSTDEV